MNYEALYDESATQEEQIACYQRLINSGDAWRLEGSVGRTAMGLIEAGTCILGRESKRDYYGTPVPSRTQVQPGTKGSYSFSLARQGKKHADWVAELT